MVCTPPQHPISHLLQEAGELLGIDPLQACLSYFLTNLTPTILHSLETLTLVLGSAGILARNLASDEKDLAEQNIQKVDFVICNLYPFKDVTKKINVTIEEAVEEIDIGGVTLLRAAAKNHGRVTIVTNPEDYPSFLDQLSKGEITEQNRQLYALKAFSHTADYDVRDTKECCILGRLTQSLCRQ